MNLYQTRLAALRKRMQDTGIDAYVILTDDFHASEYVNEYFTCRAFISGFTGSAGTLVVRADEACLWTDGRYFIQAEEQLEGSGIILQKMGEEGVPTLQEYLAEKLCENECLGYDGRTVNARFAENLKLVLMQKNISFAENVDLVGDIWENRPAFPASPVWELDVKYVGRSRAEKLAQLRAEMAKNDADSFLLAAVDDIAWLYNLRGDDVKYNPVFLSYTIVTADSAVIYASTEAFSAELLETLAKDNISVKPYLQVYEDAQALCGNVLLSRSKINVALLNSLPEDAIVIDAMNPTTVAKAIKTETEMENIRIAHIQDGVAVTKHFCWLRGIENSEDMLNGRLTEIDISDKLVSFREARPDFIEQSFGPIVATGAHAAINHYSATEETNVPVERNTFLLMDTGGQYYQGTTDITRTFAIGEVTYEMKRSYTAVLRGHLNLAAAKFRYGATGANLDCIARAPLWELGIDFNHGTGHGVGYLLNVHEDPQRIRMTSASGGEIPMEEGMLTSDEPGAYYGGRYGIRIENLMFCHKAEKTEFGQFMCFEPVTMVPYDRRSILPELMSDRELELLNAYSKKVCETLSPYLTEDERAWLEEETAEFKR